jgi:hypothetical protein
MYFSLSLSVSGLKRQNTFVVTGYLELSHAGTTYWLCTTTVCILRGCPWMTAGMLLCKISRIG